jgi:hypothetical protein
MQLCGTRSGRVTEEGEAMLMRFRKLVVIGAGLALLVGLTTGSLAAASGNKTYTVSIDPAVLSYTGTSSTSASLTVTYTNLTPSATINSVTLTPPSGYTITGVGTITESSGPAGNYNVSPTAFPTTGMIQVTNLNPVGYQVNLNIPLTVTVDTSKIDCSNNVATWPTAAYTGANLGGNTFGLVFPGKTPTNTTTIGSSLAAGATVTVVSGVTVTNNATSCAFVGISRNGNSVSVLKPAGTTLNLALKIVWDPEKAILPLPVDQVTNTGGGTNDIQWCGGTPSFDSSGNLTTTAGLTSPASDQLSCLVKETSQVYGPDPTVTGQQDVQVTDVVYLFGDYSIYR